MESELKLTKQEKIYLIQELGIKKYIIWKKDLSNRLKQNQEMLESSEIDWKRMYEPCII